MDLHSLRRTYEFSALIRKELANSPYEQFHQWFEDLKTRQTPEWFEHNAMTLSTASHDSVTSRVVLLKEFDDSGFVFFTNYHSEKSQQIRMNPIVAINFYWPIVDRQVRVQGIAEQVSRETSQKYFDSRPRSSRLGAIVSDQSAVIDSDADLEKERDELSQRVDDGLATLQVPDFWGGWRIKPQRFEFWQGRPSRLHDRFVYRLDVDGTTWKIERLAP